ncbi:hypothetical protein KKF34_08775 [Myxococcota bacterium]|nr:hypothetical protein [Myxococcota bacterium]
MSKPNMIIPGSTYMVTRRTSQRLFLMTPDDLTNKIIMYCLGFACMKFPGISLIGYIFMSNHYHMIVTDHTGDGPEFFRELNRTIAVVMNIRLNRSENYWSSEDVRYQAIATETDLVNALVYIAMNPVRAFAVSHPDEWPGVKMLPTDFGNTYCGKRPKIYFSRTGKCPVKVIFRCGLSSDTEMAKAEKRRIIDDYNKEFTRQYDDFMKDNPDADFAGASAVRTKSKNTIPESDSGRGKMNPRWQSVFAHIQQNLNEMYQKFQVAYRQALEKWCEGDYAVAFPPGTYKMNRLFGAQIDPELLDTIVWEV